MFLLPIILFEVYFAWNLVLLKISYLTYSSINAERMRAQDTMLSVKEIGIDVFYDERLLMGIFPTSNILSKSVTTNKTAELGVDFQLTVKKVIGLEPIRIDLQQYFVLVSMLQMISTLWNNSDFVPLEEHHVYLDHEINNRKRKLNQKVRVAHSWKAEGILNLKIRLIQSG